jgi:drug/metabolite transporter (DMT)-like permease
MQQGLVSPVPPPALPWLGWIGGLSLFFLVGNACLQYGAARLSASATSIIMLSEVVFASASAVMLGAGTLSARVVLGASLILLASLLATVSFRAQARQVF